MAKKQEKVNDIANWEDIASDLPDIPELVKEDYELRELIKEAEDRREEIKPTLEAAVVVGGCKSLACGDYKITQGSGRTRDTISPERVVEKAVALGLNADQIVELLEYATVKGRPYTYPLVTFVPRDVTDE